MRKTSLVVVALGTCLAWSFLADAPAVGDGFADFDGGADRLGRNPFAGTFLLDMGPNMHGIAQNHGDGTATMAVPAAANSAALGSWRRTGARQTTHVMLCFEYDEYGQPTAIFRMTAVADWDVGFDTGSGVTNQRRYELYEDPLDPTQGSDVGDVFWTARRLVP